MTETKTENDKSQPTMLAVKTSEVIADKIDPELKRKGHEVAELIEQGHHHAANAFESMRHSCEYYWQAGGIVIEIKEMLSQGNKRPIGFGEVCKSCGFSDEWATQCQRIREKYPSLENIPPVKNVTELKRLSGILAAKPTTKPAADPANETPVSKKPVKKPVEKKSADDEGIDNDLGDDPQDDCDSENDDSDIQDDPLGTVKSLVADLALIAQQLADHLPAEMPDDLLNIIWKTSRQLLEIELAAVESQVNAKVAEPERLKMDLAAQR